MFSSELRITANIIVLTILVSSCTSYKSNIMYRSKNVVNNSGWLGVEPFRIEPNDQLLVSVTSWNGEGLIIGDLNENPVNPELQVKINNKGKARLPMIGSRDLGGLTLDEADSMLMVAYSTYLKDPLVRVSFSNKNVSVIGALTTQVIPLENESVRLSKVIAISGGITNQSRSNNIKVIRGEKYFIADLSTINSAIANDIPIRPGDVIYIEPVRRPFGESLKEISPAVSIITTIITLSVLILSIL